MRSKIITILLLLGWYAYSFGQSFATAQKVDSAQVERINQAAANPNYIHAYVLTISEGKAFYSVYGHAALRMVCKEKELDYCFTFEMDMDKSSYLDVFTRKAKAGFAPVPTNQFLDSYKQEGRGAQAFELNLTPKEKQNLWKVLDEEAMNGSVWTFDYTAVNCMSMVTYAINKAIAPSQIKWKGLPAVTKGALDDWMDHVSRRSPWVRLIMHAVLRNVQDGEAKPEDLLTPEMMMEVMPQTMIVDGKGNVRALCSGKPAQLLPQVYQDEPCWFRPWMALVLAVLIIVMAIWCYRKRVINKKNVIGNSNKKKTYGNKNNKKGK